MPNLLGITLSGLQSMNQALQITSNNLTNQQTPGYSRQSADFTTLNPQYRGTAYYGSGVQVNGVLRASDSVLNATVRNNVALENQFDQYLTFSRQVGEIVADPGTSMSQGLDEFFGALQSLNQMPSSSEYRQDFLTSANLLASRANDLSGQLGNIISNMNNQITQTVTQINTMTDSIQSLNISIASSGATSSGNQPNSLLDQRDAVLNQLSQLISVNVINNNDGSIGVYGASGLNLVNGAVKTQLYAGQSSTDPLQIDIFTNPSNQYEPITDRLSGGQLGGLQSLRNEVIYPSLNNIGRVCITLADSFNAQHQLGVDLNGQLGETFFQDVNDTVISQARAIANYGNRGNAVLSVDINAITPPPTGPFEVFGLGSSLQASGSLANLGTVGGLQINGVNITATSASDDPLSPAQDASASGISLAKAINLGSALHGVTASACANVVNLGQFTSGTFAANQFVINGTSIVTTSSDPTSLINSINLQTGTTGVEASLDSNNNVLLTALDGRNIQLSHDNTVSTANFGYFTTNQAGPLSLTQKSQVTLKSNNAISIAGPQATSLGFALGTTPAKNSSLTDSDYDLQYNGSNYTLTRTLDNVVVFQSNAGPITADGFSINIDAGLMQPGDAYTIRPTRGGAANFQVVLGDLNKIALASPIAAVAEDSNRGSGAIAVEAILNTSGTPVGSPGLRGNAFNRSGALTPPIRIEFVDETSYLVLDYSNPASPQQIGSVQTYDPTQKNNVFPLSGVIDYSLPGPNEPAVYDPGYRVSLSGPIKPKDVFTVNYFDGAVGDNSNGLLLNNLANANLLNGNQSSFDQVYAELVGTIGSLSLKSQNNYDAAQTLRMQSQDQQQSVSGVNMDEEAANLLKYQQAYQALTQLINVQRTLFDTLLNSVRA